MESFHDWFVQHHGLEPVPVLLSMTIVVLGMFVYVWATKPAPIRIRRIEMLVLQIPIGEPIFIGEGDKSVVLTVEKLGRSSVKLSFQAGKDKDGKELVPIVRGRAIANRKKREAAEEQVTPTQASS